MKFRTALIAAGIMAASVVASIAAPSQAPSAFLGSNYVFATAATNGIITNLAANVDYICIPRTNVNPALTAAMCTNDMRSMIYFFVKRTHDVIDALATTNKFKKISVTTGSFNTTVSNLVQRSFTQTFTLDAAALAPAGE